MRPPALPLATRPPYVSVGSRAARERLTEHYDSGAGLYKFWASPRSVFGAIAFGWEHDRHPAELHYAWDLEHASSLDDAIRETTRQAIALLALHEAPRVRVYEMGCGVAGGVSQVTAMLPHAQVVGLTLVQRQAQIGRARLRALGQTRGHLACGNYLASPFADATFDGIFGIETAVYTPPGERDQLFREMFRLLKPGCRLVVLDGVTLREPITTREIGWVQDVLDGWTMPAPATLAEFGRHAEAAGFEVLRQENVTRSVYASAGRIAAIASYVLRPLASMGRVPPLGPAIDALGFRSRRHASRFVAACRAQVRVFDEGLGAYCAQVFRKPRA